MILPQNLFSGQFQGWEICWPKNIEEKSVKVKKEKKLYTHIFHRRLNWTFRLHMVGLSKKKKNGKPYNVQRVDLGVMAMKGYSTFVAVSYPSAEMYSVYSTVSADWAECVCGGGVPVHICLLIRGVMITVIRNWTQQAEFKLWTSCWCKHSLERQLSFFSFSLSLSLTMGN